MSQMQIDMKALNDFSEQLKKIDKQKEKERRTLLRKQGSELRKMTIREARANVRKVAIVRKQWKRVAGEYHKSIKRGRYYKYHDGADCIRVYSNDKISHLIELGFVPILRNKRPGPRVAGKNVFARAKSSFEPRFYSACEEFVTGYKGAIEK